MIGSAVTGNSGSARRRAFTPRALMLGLAALAAASLMPTAANAACRQGFCVSGYDQNGIHVVNFTVSIRNYTHINASTPQGQVELGRNQRQFSFRNGPVGQLESYGLQACYKGTFLSKSSCTPWAMFTHTPR